MKKRRALPIPGKPNAACPCGSGRMLLQCCGSKDVGQRMADAVLAHQSGRIAEAEAGYRAIVKLNPEHADALHYLGMIHFQQGDATTAVTLIRHAIGRRPDVAAYHVNLGRVLYAEEDIDGSAEAYRAALKLAPNFLAALQGLGSLLLRFGDVDGALECFARALQVEPSNELICASRLFALGLSSRQDGASILAEHRAWQARFAEGVKPVTLSPRQRGGRLRMAYLSGDLRRHAMRFFVRPLLRHHDRQRVEVTVYATHAPGQSDEFTAELRSLADHWVDVHALDKAALAQRIAADAIDVLVDLSGHSAGGRMLALAAHPARFQCSMLGYMTTTGARAIDARIADAVAVPVSAEPWFAEKVLRLPHSQWCYEPDADTPPVGELPAARNGFVTYGAFHNVAKINSAVLDLWARLLQCQPQARLLLVGWGEAAKRWLRAPFERAGVGERVSVRDPLPFAQYLTLYQDVDIALDVFPYAGGTVNCEALWMGVPVLTLAHDSPAGRGGASIMSAIGMPEWIAVDADDWLRRAASLADPAALADLRGSLRERMRVSPLMDGPAYVAALENLLAGQL